MTFDVVQHSRKLSKLIELDIPFVTVTLLDIRGSAPQINGAKALITAHGLEWGTVGGGKIEAAAISFAQETLKTHRGTTCKLVKWNLQTDIGMTCGGEVKFFFEIHNKGEWNIAVFGAGHVAQFLIPMLLKLHCRVTCVDSRPEWIEKLPDHPKLNKITPDDPASLVSQFTAQTFFVLVSKGHAADLPVLAKILSSREAPYIGVIGSEQKAKVLKRELTAAGISAEKQQAFVCPIGLPIGNNTPAEISFSIVAQLIQCRDQAGILDHKSKSFSSVQHNQ
ncbi:MAG TPA: xanthine dehydrogenase accessory protein XdhC [Rhodopirellula sp.]|nr:xanthine dehydrogenase accessory protein XdhC [Rhodopirellula sp.]